MKQENQLWYIKKQGKVKGPFTAGMISQHILLGRIHPNDPISQDKQIWRKASSVREVMPDVIKHRNDPNYQERLKAAKRWADERGEVREVGRDGEQRVYTPRKKVTHLGIKTMGFFGFLVVFAALSGLIYVSFIFEPEDNLTSNCESSGQDDDVFDGCHLQRKDFSKKSLNQSSFKNALLQNSRFIKSKLENSEFDYANLSQANLTKANFTRASLRAVDLRGTVLIGTNFTEADLSYADLTGAKVSKINLTDAKLANTIWFDGNVCHQQSIGRCLRPKNKK